MKAGDVVLIYLTDANGHRVWQKGQVDRVRTTSIINGQIGAMFVPLLEHASNQSKRGWCLPEDADKYGAVLGTGPIELSPEEKSKLAEAKARADYAAWQEKCIAEGKDITGSRPLTPDGDVLAPAAEGDEGPEMPPVSRETLARPELAHVQPKGTHPNHLTTPKPPIEPLPKRKRVYKPKPKIKVMAKPQATNSRKGGNPSGARR